jgi:hypothetical protein
MGINITSKLEIVKENTIIGWSGKSIGMHAIHIWKFEIQSKQTKVITEESLSGWLPRIIKFFNPDFLNQSLTEALSVLKHQAEKTSPPPTPMIHN